MRYNLADLHVHSYCSDGLRTPTQAAEEAFAAGLVAVSLTDHDTVAGVDEAMAAGQRLGVRVVPGAEFSAHLDDREVHLLAYFFDRRDARLLQHLERLRDNRRDRGTAIVERLNALGVEVTIEDVLHRANGGMLGRPHIAAAMVDRGAVPTKELAFDLYIGDRKPADVPKPRIPYAELIALVHQLGGVTVLAHPGNSVSEATVARLAEAGMDGIEVYHPAHQPPQIEHYTEMAERYHLLPAGGSDSHGEPEGTRIGDYGIGCEAVEALSARAATYA
ncbi:MAG: PHP domain-containing protein [Gemmatimonadota bacterium]